MTEMTVGVTELSWCDRDDRWCDRDDCWCDRDDCWCDRDVLVCAEFRPSLRTAVVAIAVDSLQDNCQQWINTYVYVVCRCSTHFFCHICTFLNMSAVVGLFSVQSVSTVVC